MSLTISKSVSFPEMRTHANPINLSWKKVFVNKFSDYLYPGPKYCTFFSLVFLCIVGYFYLILCHSKVLCRCACPVCCAQCSCSSSLRPLTPRLSSARLQDSAASSQYSVPQESSMNRNPAAPKNKAKKRSTFILSAGDMSQSVGLSVQTFLFDHLLLQKSVFSSVFNHLSACLCFLQHCMFKYTEHVSITPPSWQTQASGQYFPSHTDQSDSWSGWMKINTCIMCWSVWRDTVTEGVSPTQK